MNVPSSLVFRCVLRASTGSTTKQEVNDMLCTAGLTSLHPVEFGLLRDAINQELSAGSSKLLTKSQAESLKGSGYDDARAAFHNAKAYERQEFYETMTELYELLVSLQESTESPRSLHLAYAKHRAKDLAWAYKSIENREHCRCSPVFHKDFV